MRCDDSIREKLRSRSPPKQRVSFLQNTAMKGGKDSGFGQFSGSKGPSAFKST